jgi:hypothetical protein
VDDAGESPIPGHHVHELAGFFAAHDRWLFGHACVRTQGDRELAADLVQDTFEAAAVAWAVLRGHPSGRQRAWLLGTLAHKDISDLRRKAAFRRRQPEIHARYQATPADTEAQALNAIALARAREIIDGMPRTCGSSSASPSATPGVACRSLTWSRQAASAWPGQRSGSMTAGGTPSPPMSPGGSGRP